MTTPPSYFLRETCRGKNRDISPGGGSKKLRRKCRRIFIIVISSSPTLSQQSWIACPSAKVFSPLLCLENLRVLFFIAQDLFFARIHGKSRCLCTPHIHKTKTIVVRTRETKKGAAAGGERRVSLSAHFFAHFSFDAHSPYGGYRGRRRVGCGRRAALFWLRTFGLLPLRMRRGKKGSDRAHHAVRRREGLPLCLHLALRRDLPSPPSLVVVLQWAHIILTSFKTFELLF